MQEISKEERKEVLVHRVCGLLSSLPPNILFVPTPLCGVEKLPKTQETLLDDRVVRLNLYRQDTPNIHTHTSDVLEHKWRASLKTILFLYE